MRFFLDLAFGDYVTALKVLLIPLKFLGCTEAGLASVTALYLERKERTKDIYFKSVDGH